MNVIVLGKSGGMGGWAENVCRAFEKEGHNTYAFSINGNSRFQHLKYKLYKSKQTINDKYTVARFEKFISKRPVDICVSLCGYTIPAAVYECLRRQYPECLNIAWVGEKFNETSRYSASLFDQIYYTDTQFIIDHRELGFESQVNYMPHAVDTEIFSVSNQTRIPKMLFVANRTALREQIVGSIKSPIQVNGRGWRRYRHHSQHSVSPHRVSLAKLPELYRNYLAVLNVKNENHMVNGLNQRSFEPYGCKTLVVHDAVSDVERCFEPGNEILVYKDENELNGIYERILKDPEYAKKIAEAGFNRVNASHTYKHRIAEFVRAAN